MVHRVIIQLLIVKIKHMMILN